MSPQDKNLLNIANGIKRKLGYYTIYTHEYEGELVLEDLNRRKAEIDRLLRELASESSMLKSISINKRCSLSAFTQAKKITGDIQRALEDEGAAIRILRHKYCELHPKVETTLAPLSSVTGMSGPEILYFLLDLIDSKVDETLKGDQVALLTTIRSFAKNQQKLQHT
jgi:hypothetical protein